MKVTPGTGLLPASFAVAMNCWVRPAWIEESQGVSVMELTADELTVSVVPLLTGPMVAPMIVEPPEAPVASPLLFTVATAGLLDVHVKVTPGTGLPPASFAVAMNCWVPPAWIEESHGVSVMELTVVAASNVPVLTGPMVAPMISVQHPRNVASPFTCAAAMILTNVIYSYPLVCFDARKTVPSSGA